MAAERTQTLLEHGHEDGAERLFLVSSDPQLELPAVAAAARNGVRQVVKSSALGFGQDPPVGHRAVEQRIEETDVAWTHLRPNAFMQTLAGYLPDLINDEGEFALPAGDGRTAFVDTRDIAAVATEVLTAQGREQGAHSESAYLVTGPRGLTMSDVAAELSTVLKRSVTYVPVEPNEATRRMIRLGLPQDFAGFLVEHYTSVRNGGFEVVSDTVERITGTPPRSLGAFAAEHAGDWLRAG